MADTRQTRAKTRRPVTLEATQNELVALAVEEARKRLLDGTVTSQVLIHYLSMGTVEAGLEREKLKLENEHLRAKTEALKSAQHLEELFANALKAWSSYGGPQFRQNEDGDDVD
jgi:hypothetical protein